MFGEVVPLGEGTFTDLTGELWLIAADVALMLQQVLAVAVGTLAQRALVDRAIYCADTLAIQLNPAIVPNVGLNKSIKISLLRYVINVTEPNYCN